MSQAWPPPQKKNLQKNEIRCYSTLLYYWRDYKARRQVGWGWGEDKDLCNEWVIRGSRRCGSWSSCDRSMTMSVFNPSSSQKLGLKVTWSCGWMWLWLIHQPWKVLVVQNWSYTHNLEEDDLRWVAMAWTIFQETHKNSVLGCVTFLFLWVSNCLSK